MARDAAELKEVLQSVSNMLKPFYAQVILCVLHPIFIEDRDYHTLQASRQKGQKDSRITTLSLFAVQGLLQIQSLGCRNQSTYLILIE